MPGIFATAMPLSRGCSRPEAAPIPRCSRSICTVQGGRRGPAATRRAASLRAVLEGIDMRTAATPRGALTRLLFGRARIRLRGLSFRERDPRAIDPAELVRIDACRSAAIGLSMIDTIQGADFQARHTLLALRAGEPGRIATALTLEARHVASIGGTLGQPS